ncbi:MAG: PilZ domain-containing protein [Candidatus Omnitrophica bacterium]|nr:PilZ domain-containing protein [Candidatus Omnitrophota bacterium]
MDDRRNSQRINVSFPVECVLLPERKKMFYTVSKDLSGEGLKILSEEFMARGKFIKLSINLINEMAESKVKVIWCNKKARSDRYYIGLKIMEINTIDKSHLYHFINKII